MPRGRKPKTIVTIGAADGAMPPDAPRLRLSELSAKEKALAARARIRKRCALDLTLEEYEAALTLADENGEDLSVVLRAAHRYGMESLRGFGGRLDVGSWRPRYAQDQLGRPGPMVAAFDASAQNVPQMEVRTFSGPTPPAPREFVTESQEPVFARPDAFAPRTVQLGDRVVDLASVLPSGATDDIRHAPMESPADAQRVVEEATRAARRVMHERVAQDEADEHAQAHFEMQPAVMEFVTAAQAQPPTHEAVETVAQDDDALRRDELAAVDIEEFL